MSDDKTTNTPTLADVLEQLERTRAEIEPLREWARAETDAALGNLPREQRDQFGALLATVPLTAQVGVLRAVAAMRAAAASAPEADAPAPAPAPAPAREPARSAPVVRGPPVGARALSRDELERNPDLLRDLPADERRDVVRAYFHHEDA